MKKLLFACLFFQFPSLACAATPASAKPAASGPVSVAAETSAPNKPALSKPAAAVSDAERYARRCQSQAAHRWTKPQGTMLWGTKRSWDTEKVAEERSSVLVSAELSPLRQAGAGVQALRLEGGHLMASPAPAAGVAASGVVGTVLQGADSEGKPVEVAICGAEASPEDTGMVLYSIEAWNTMAQEWENPCVALDRSPNPRALAMSGVWDGSGAHHDVPGKLTFACQNGAVAKCALWGYKPWASHNGQSLAELHQACTRMARADYCGDGHNHTHQDTIIDMYDRLGVIPPATEVTEDWDPKKGAFEAAWAPDGATCLARTRDGRAMATILQECPNRFQTGTAIELGEGDRCMVRHADVSPEAPLLRNRSYPHLEGPAAATPTSASKAP
ncbi:MAG: ADYC domain-containing protein [Hyalangium sp.]